MESRKFFLSVNRDEQDIFRIKNLFLKRIELALKVAGSKIR